MVRAWQTIAEGDEVFRYGRSNARTLTNIARDMGIDRLTREIRGMGNDMFYIALKAPPGVARVPRGIVTLDPTDKTVWLDVSSVGQGNQGSALYQLVMQWAKNNGYTFIGDPGGVSEVGAIRRTENMVSGALRLGTTKWMRPAPEQHIEGWREVAQEGDANDISNLALLLKKNLEYVRRHVPEVERLWYNFERETFVDEHGNPITIADVRPGHAGTEPSVVFLDRRGNPVALAGRDQRDRQAKDSGTGNRGRHQGVPSRAFEGGSRTVARAVLTRQFLRAGPLEKRHDRILGELLQGRAAPLQLGATPLARILHSRAQRPTGVAESKSDERPAQSGRSALDPRKIAAGFRALKARGTLDPQDQNILRARPKRPVDAAAHAERQIFYSELLRKVEESGFNAAPAKQWKSFIANLTQKGVKAEEIEWSGINDWLDALDGRVSKEAIVSFLKDNGPRVTEIVLGEPPPVSEDDDVYVEEKSSEGNVRYYVTSDGKHSFFVWFEKKRSRPYMLGGQRADGMWHYMIDNKPERRGFETTERSAYARALDALGIKLNPKVRRPEPVQYESWKLPGGEDYREILLTLPNTLPAGWRVEPWRDSGQYQVLDAEGDQRGIGATPQEAIDNAYSVPVMPGRRSFEAPHFRPHNRNLLAHVRFDTRLDKEGRKVLFVEEFQSDWAERGRVEGFRRTRDQARFNELLAEAEALEADRDPVTNVMRNEERWHRVVDEMRRLQETTGDIPLAPFVTKTESWLALLLKRVIRWAVDKGFDRVAWTTGEQQAERYNLSRQVDEIEWQKTDDGHVMIRAHKGGVPLRVFDGGYWGKFPLSGLHNVLGKEMTEKIERDSSNEGILSGVDLVIGGDGMKTFYDRIVPNIANDVLKKLGGGRVQHIAIPIEGVNPDAQVIQGRDGYWYIGDENGPAFGTEEEARAELLAQRQQHNVTARQPGFEITDKLKERARAGLPLFSRVRRPGDARTIEVDGKRRPHPEQIKSAIGNRGTYSARVSDILRRRATHPGQQAAPTMLNRTALATAQAAASAAKPVTKTLDFANRALEGALKLPAQYLVKPVTSWVYDRVTGAASRAAKKSAVVQSIAHGVVSDYGLPEPYLDARQDRETAINRHLRKSKELIDRIGSLDRAQSRIAYLWMQEEPATREEQDLLAALPADSRQALLEMKQQIDDLGQEAVRLGLLSQESYERNRMAYLHRTYKKYELEDPKGVATSKRAKAIRAETYRGRGLRDDVAESVVRGAVKGDRYLRLEKRRPDGVLQRVVYLREGAPIPLDMQNWKRDGVWEARFFDKAGQVGMWRDLNPEERLRLGEIDEVRYAFARTMIAAVRDIETARFLEWVMQNYSVADAKEVTAKGGRIAEAADKTTTLTTYADDEWVEVPMTYAQGTKIRKYGLLAGRYIPGHIWNDIRATINWQSASAVGRLYEQLMRGWKIAKTALSPAVHTNNIMANFVLADLADVKSEDLRRALKVLLAAKQGDANAKAMMERFYDSGAESGSFAAIELRAEVIEPLLKELESEQDETLSTLSFIQAFRLAQGGAVKRALVALAHNSLVRKAGRMGSTPFKAMIDLYRSEDSVFRLAKFLQGVEQGQSDKEAGKAARKAFLDYNINAPWVQAARRTGLPFIAFTYRVVPVLAEAAAKKPWKLMKYYVVGSALNALAYAALGLGGGDEDRERKLLPEEKSGRALGIFPRLIRMPWNDQHGSPVFLDVRRWIPGGDIFDVQGSFAAIPAPQWLTIGGPLALMIELASNKSMFTGRPIWKDSDTAGEKVVRVMDHVFKFASPNLPLPNPLGYALDTATLERGLFQTYSWKSIQAAGTGETDAFGRERSLGQAVAGAFGVKLGSYPADVGVQNLTRKRAAELREVGEREAELRRQLARGGLTGEQFAERMRRQQEKRQDIARRYGEKLGLEPIAR